MLKDLVVGANSHCRKVLLLVVLASIVDGLSDDVMDAADRDIRLEQISQQFDDPAQRTAENKEQR